MKVELKPVFEQFVVAQVNAGRFESADAVVEAALSRLQFDDTIDFAPGELDRLLAEGEKSLRDGRGYTLDAVRQHFSAKTAE